MLLSVGGTSQRGDCHAGPPNIRLRLRILQRGQLHTRTVCHCCRYGMAIALLSVYVPPSGFLIVRSCEPNATDGMAKFNVLSSRTVIFGVCPQTRTGAPATNPLPRTWICVTALPPFGVRCPIER